MANRAAIEGITPLEVFLADMRFHYARAEAELAKGNKGDPVLVTTELAAARCAAKDAAPYIHPRLQAIAHSGSMTLTHEEALRQLAEEEDGQED